VKVKALRGTDAVPEGLQANVWRIHGYAIKSKGGRMGTPDPRKLSK